MPKKTINLPIKVAFNKKEMKKIIKIFAQRKDLSGPDSKLILKRFKDFNGYNQKVMETIFFHIGKAIKEKPEFNRYILPNIITTIPQVLYEAVMENPDLQLTHDEQTFIAKIFLRLGKKIMPDNLNYIG